MPLLLASATTLAGASGCGPEHPPSIEDTPRGGSSGRGGSGAVSSGASDGEGGSDGGGGSGSVEPIPEGLFDPEQVYVAAVIQGTDKWAVAPVEDPTNVVVGLDMRSVLGLWGTHLVYHEAPSRPVHRLIADEVRPDTLEGLVLPASLRNNDAIMETGPCTGRVMPQYSGPSDFLVAPGSRFLHRCLTDSRRWYEGANVLGDLPDTFEILLVASDDLLLVRYRVDPDSVDENLGVMHWGDTEPVFVQPFASGGTFRAAPDEGILIATASVSDGIVTHGLSHLDASGELVTVGTYDTTCGAAMSADGNCYGLAYGDEITSIYRQNLDGATEEIYVPEPGMILEGITGNNAVSAFLFTGP